MRAVVIAFLLGCLAVTVAALAAALCIAFLVEVRAVHVVDVSAGGLLLVRAVTTQTGVEATLGAGVAVAAVVGGGANALAAAVLASRRR